MARWRWPSGCGGAPASGFAQSWYVVGRTCTWRHSAAKVAVGTAAGAVVLGISVKAIATLAFALAGTAVVVGVAMHQSRKAAPSLESAAATTSVPVSTAPSPEALAVPPAETVIASASAEPPPVAQPKPKPKRAARRRPVRGTVAPPPAPNATDEAAAVESPLSKPPVEVDPELPEGTFGHELQLLEMARRALGTNPVAALRFLNQHAREFPNGALSHEREVLIIDALRQSGQTDAARTRARSYIAKYPNSLHAERMRGWLEP